MSPRLRAALGNWLGIILLSVGAAAAVVIAVVPGFKAPWLVPAAILLGLAAYGLTVLVYYWVPESVAESEQVKALRRLRDSIAERLQAQGQGEALGPVLSDALRRLDQEMIPAVQRLAQRHALLCRDLGRFRSGEILSPDRERMEQLTKLQERQELAIETVGRQAANAYASLIMLIQQTDDDARLAADAKQWSNELFETQENLSQLLDDEAQFDRELAERSRRRKSA